MLAPMGSVIVLTVLSSAVILRASEDALASTKYQEEKLMEVHAILTWYQSVPHARHQGRGPSR